MNLEEYGTGYMPLPAIEALRGLPYAAAPVTADDVDLTATYTVNPSPVEDQGRLGSCVGHAVTSALECLGISVPSLSRRDVWQRAKNLRGFTGNVGVYLNDGCDVALDGVAGEADWPYTDQEADQAEPGGLTRHDAMGAHRLIQGDIVAGIAAALSRGNPVVFGIWMDGGSFYQAFQQGGLVDKHNRSAAQDVAHAMYFWRRNGSRRLTVCRNSWGMAMNPAVSPVEEAMLHCDLAFTDDVLRTAVFEAREIVAETVQPKPEPQPIPITEYLEFWTHRNYMSGPPPVPAKDDGWVIASFPATKGWTRRLVVQGSTEIHASDFREV